MFKRDVGGVGGGGRAVHCDTEACPTSFQKPLMRGGEVPTAACLPVTFASVLLPSGLWPGSSQPSGEMSGKEDTAQDMEEDRMTGGFCPTPTFLSSQK